MSNIKFTSTELKTRIKNLVVKKLESKITYAGGFNGIVKADFRGIIANAFPDVSNELMLEILGELTAAGIIEEV